MSDVTRAIAAATSVAASLDLPASDAIVLHNSNRLALRLTPCDVLARVAPVGHEAAQFEVELAQRLAEVGCPVGLLEPRVDPLVYTRDGFDSDAVDLLRARDTSRLTSRLRQGAGAAARRHAQGRCAEPAVHGSDRGGGRSRCQPGSLAGARRRRPRVPQRQARKPATGDRATAAPRNNCSTASRIKAMCSARRTARCSSTLRRAAVDPSSSTSPMFPRRSASTTRTSTKDCWTSAGSSSSRWSQRGAGSLATSFRTGGDSEKNSCARCARVLPGRHRHGDQATGRPVETADGHLKAAGNQAATLRSFSQCAASAPHTKTAKLQVKSTQPRRSREREPSQGSTGPAAPASPARSAGGASSTGG